MPPILSPHDGRPKTEDRPQSPVPRQSKSAKKTARPPAKPKAPTGARTPSIKNRYDAGGTGRRLSFWRPAPAGPNAAILADLDLLRSRSRDATRNNGWIKKGISSWVSNEIGTGIVPRSRAKAQRSEVGDQRSVRTRATDQDLALRAKIDELWDDWSAVADADGVLDVYGLQALASRTRVEGGEVFIRLRQRSLKDDLPVPLQLQFLEPEFCPSTTNEALPNSDRTIRAGVEFNRLGKRTAYWMHRTHPGETFNGSVINELMPVPAASVLHHYAPLRAGQIRGVPWTVQALIKSHAFDSYDDAELDRKLKKSSYTGAIVRQNYSEDDFAFDPISGAPLERDAAENAMMTVETGSFVSLLPGEDLKFFDGDTTGAGYADFVRQQLMGAAAALDIPYEFLSGDMSKVNDRLMRVILNEFHRILEQTQWHLTIPQVCYPTWAAFMDMAVLSGALDLPDYYARRKDYLMVEWRPQRWEYIHPVQDVEARSMEVSAGFTSRSRVVAERGESAEEVDQQNSEDKKRAEGLGLTYTTHNEAPAPDAGDEADARRADDDAAARSAA